MLVVIDEDALSLAHVAREDLPPQRRFQLALDRAFEGSSPVDRVVADLDELPLREAERWNSTRRAAKISETRMPKEGSIKLRPS